MNLQQLTTFCTVLSEGSMTAAAEKLYLTQPAVSQQIRALEDELRVALLVRGMRQVKPTMQGQLLYDYAKKILHLTQQAEVAINTMSQEISGRIRLATTNSMGLYLVSPVVGMLLRHNPNLRVQVHYDAGPQIVELLREQKVDLAILPEIKSEFGIEFDSFESQFLMKDEMWLVASGRDSTLPLNTDVKQLTSRPIVLFASMYPRFRKMLQTKLDQYNMKIEPVIEADNVGTLKRVIESGLGWGFMPSHSIRKQVRTRRLIHINVDEMRYSVNINLYSRRDENVKKVAAVFYRALQQQALS